MLIHHKIYGKDMVVPAYADKKEIIDVNIVAVSGNRIGVYDKALPVKVVPDRVGGGLTTSLSHTTGHTVHVPRRFLMLIPVQTFAVSKGLR